MILEYAYPSFIGIQAALLTIDVSITKPELLNNSFLVRSYIQSNFHSHHSTGAVSKRFDI